jgi:hypothetical protein
MKVKTTGVQTNFQFICGKKEEKKRKEKREKRKDL